jgi:Carboxypeptidase regulatory-like domain
MLWRNVALGRCTHLAFTARGSAMILAFRSVGVAALCLSLAACQTTDAVNPAGDAPQSGSPDLLRSSPGAPSSGSPEAPTSSSGAVTQDSISQGVAGRVLSTSGRAIAGVLVTAQGAAANSPAVPELAVITGTNGAFEWPLQPGTYDLIVTAPSGAKANQRVTVGQGLVNVTLVVR